MTKPGAYLALFLIGCTWGLTIAVTKIAVSTGYQPFGLIAWQLTVSVLCLFGLNGLRGARFRADRSHFLLFGVVALFGTLIPNAFSYLAAAKLPAGIVALVIAMVPMFSLPLALWVGLERAEGRRLFGLLLGALAMAAILGPDASLPDPGLWIWVLAGLVAPACYAVEGTYVAARGTGGLSPSDTILGASLLGLAVAWPVAVATGTAISPLGTWDAAKWAVLAVGLLHVVAYSAFIWLIGRTGPVFSSQVAYVVTGTGVIWSILLLNERYSLWVWAALGLILAGIALVSPRKDTSDR